MAIRSLTVNVVAHLRGLGGWGSLGHLGSAWIHEAVSVRNHQQRASGRGRFCRRRRRQVVVVVDDVLAVAVDDDVVDVAVGDDDGRAG